VRFHATPSAAFAALFAPPTLPVYNAFDREIWHELDVLQNLLGSQLRRFQKIGWSTGGGQKSGPSLRNPWSGWTSQFFETA